MNWKCIVGIWCIAGCSSAEKKSAPPPPKPLPPVTAPASRPAAPETVRPLAGPRPNLGADDYWYDRFHEYMPEDVRGRYLATPPEERFRAFGEVLLDYQRRDAALDPYRARLDRADLERYHALPDLESCARFLAARFPGEDEPGNSNPR
jgi:hypothetical protein